MVGGISTKALRVYQKGKLRQVWPPLRIVRKQARPRARRGAWWS